MSRSLASFFRQVFLKEPSETSIKFKNKKCQNNLKNLNSSFDKTPGHFGSGFCSVKCSAHGGNRGRSDGSLVKCRCGLRAKCRFLRFARKRSIQPRIFKSQAEQDVCCQEHCIFHGNERLHKSLNAKKYQIIFL